MCKHTYGYVCIYIYIYLWIRQCEDTLQWLQGKPWRGRCQHLDIYTFTSHYISRYLSKKIPPCDSSELTTVSQDFASTKWSCNES